MALTSDVINGVDKDTKLADIMPNWMKSPLMKDDAYLFYSAADIAASQTAAGGYKPFGGSDVPEPTSGILLLVGGAMLALRRKQK